MVIFDSPNARTKIAEATGTIAVPGVHRCISTHDKHGNILGGVLFTDYTGSSVQLHTAGFAKNWLSRPLLYCVFDYTFELLAVRKAFTIVEKSNVKALDLSRHLGFKERVEISDWFPSGPAVISEMTKDECKYMLPNRVIRKAR